MDSISQTALILSATQIIMAAKATDPTFDKEQENKLFIQLFTVSGLMLALIILAALIGLYNIL